ncbi:hypothetical protein DFH11DRAFT_1516216 [Phellopilus nigrolimitatus]|nr:hypothetical protein DFH11DRAFT_1516216 [Phellopilus nigrolimitatus]
MAIGIDEVTLVSIFVECVLYVGFFTFLFSLSVYVLLFKKKGKNEHVNRPMLIVSIVMFILATVHVAADLRRVLTAYLDEENTVKYLSMVNTPIYALKSTAYCMQTLVGDGFMLYRLYLIYSGDKRIYGPILICFIASIGVGIGALQGFARASPTAPVFISELQDWIVSFFSLTLFTNFSCTLLIAARIFWIHRRLQGAVRAGPSVFPAAMIIIESGSAYSACLIILLSLYLSGSFAQYIVLDGVTQVIGVVFSLIIVRVGLGLSTDAVTYSSDAMLSTFAAAGQGSGHDRQHRNSLTANVKNPLHRNYPRPPRPVTVTISQMETTGSIDQTESSFSAGSAARYYEPRSEDGGWKYHPFEDEIAEDKEGSEHHEMSDSVSKFTDTVALR